MEKILIARIRINELKEKLTTYIGSNIENTKDLNNVVLMVREYILKGDTKKASMIRNDLKRVKKEFGEFTIQDVVESIVKHCVMTLKPNCKVRMRRLPTMKLSTNWDD